MAIYIDRNAPESGIASLLAMQGNRGDTELVHMTKPEVKTMMNTGLMSMNKETGLPEFGKGEDLLKFLIPMAASVAFPALLGPSIGSALGIGALGGSAVATGLGSFAGGLLTGQDPGDALMGGLLSGGMSYGLGSAFPETFGMSEAAAATPDGSIVPAGMYPSGPAPITQAVSSPNISTDYLKGSSSMGPYSGNMPTSTHYFQGPAGTLDALPTRLPTPFQEFAGAAPSGWGEGYIDPNMFRPGTVSQGGGPQGVLIKSEIPGQGPYGSGDFMEYYQTPPWRTPGVEYGGHAEAIPRPPFADAWAETAGYLPSQGPSLQDKPPLPSAFTDAWAETAGYLPSQGPSLRDYSIREAGPIRYGDYRESPVNKWGQSWRKFKDELPTGEEFTERLFSEQSLLPAVSGLGGTVLGDMFTEEEEEVTTTSKPSAAERRRLEYNYNLAPNQLEGLNASQIRAILEQGSLARFYERPSSGAGVFSPGPTVPAQTGGGLEDLISESVTISQNPFEGRVPGQGHGMQDNQMLPIMKKGGIAAVSPDEYVVPADVMSMIGNGSANSGANTMDDFIEEFRTVKYGRPTQPPEINPRRALQSLMKT